MTLGANLYVDIRVGRTGNKCVTAVAGYGCLIVLRMDSFSHILFTSLIIRELPAQVLIPGQYRSDTSTVRYPGLTPQVPAVL